MENIWKLLISLIIPFIAAAFGSFFTKSSLRGWYKKIKKPSLNPPGWIFGPVWTVLYLLMGLSLFLIWITNPLTIAIVIFSVQLFLNMMWSIFFFGMQKPRYAFADSILLWISILVTIVVFYSINPLASYLLIPYVLWVSFASYLNYMIVKLN